ncbi:MAG: amidohydrolase family protein [Alphaproteobacteria bacterium]|nr:amidohydrolase family protein [Alphaproteobacteria bacterium]
MPRRTVSLALVALLAATAAQATTYNHVTLIDGTGAAARQDMAIVVDGERITAITPAVKSGTAKAGSAESANAESSGDIVDMRGAFALPGLINTHVHLATSPDIAFAQATLRRDVYSGVTAVRDMAGDTRELGFLAREARIGHVPGPDVYYASLMAGPEFFHDPRTVDSTQGGFTPGETPWMRAVTPATDLALAVAEAKGTGATAIKIYADLPAPLVAAITQEAHRQHLLVWAHAAVFPASPREVTDAGVDVMSHACMLGYQASATMPPAYHHRAAVEAARLGDPSIDALLADMKAKGTILDATLTVYELLDHMKDANPPPYCTLAMAQTLTAKAHRAGVDVSAGTDSDTPWKERRSALQGELALLVRGAGFTPMEAIRAATQVASRTIGRDKEMGTLESGKLANIVFAAKDPLADIANLEAVTLTVKRGKAFAAKDYPPITAAEAQDSGDD